MVATGSWYDLPLLVHLVVRGGEEAVCASGHRLLTPDQVCWVRLDHIVGTCIIMNVSKIKNTDLHISIIIWEGKTNKQTVW